MRCRETEEYLRYNVKVFIIYCGTEIVSFFSITVLSIVKFSLKGISLDSLYHVDQTYI